MDEKKWIEWFREYVEFIRFEKDKGKKEYINLIKYDFKVVNYEKKCIRLEEVEKLMELLREIGFF